MHQAVRPFAVALAAALALTGCAITPPSGPTPAPTGGNGTQAPPTDTRPVPSPTVATTDPPAAPMEEQFVYFPRESRTGVRLAREVREVPQEDPLRGVLEALIAGPLDPDYLDAWAPGTRVLSAGTSGGVTTVDLSAEAREGQALSSELALAHVDQIIWTVTELVGTDTEVVLTIEGRAPGALWGSTAWDGPRGRADPLGPRVFVSIDTPAEGATTESPVTVVGDANAIAGQVQWAIRDASGGTVVEGIATTEEGMGFHPYAFEVDLPAGEYVVEVGEDDVSDGETGRRDVDTRRFTVTG